MSSADGPLACPHCKATYPESERFCAECGIPLVHAGHGEMEPITDAHGRARKIRPQYARGELVKVAVGRNQAEGELIQGMLLEEGIPSILRRTRGFDVPDFLAAGPRDVMVPEAAYEAARGMLDAADVPAAGTAEQLASDRGTAVRLAVGILVALVVGGLLFWLVFVLSM